jgi:alpha-ribazole phosphatase
VEIYLIRHGETESNKERRYLGWTESPLSELGLRQAEAVGHYLASQGIDELYCSDLNRALHTARVIGAGSGLKPIITPLLREIHFGQWEGLTFDEIEKEWGSAINHWLDDPFHKEAPGGESLRDVCERMKEFLTTVSEATPDGKRIVAVSHGGSIRALLYNILHLEHTAFWDIKIGNASVTLIRRAEECFKVDYYNRTHHLDGGGSGGEKASDL